LRYWEIIADNLSKAGWIFCCVSAIDSSGRTIFVADAHRDDSQRFIERADEKLTAFMELESAIRVQRRTDSHFICQRSSMALARSVHRLRFLFYTLSVR